MPPRFRPFPIVATGLLALAGAGCATSPEARQRPGAEARMPPETEQGTELQRAPARAQARLEQAQRAVQEQQLQRARPLVEQALGDLRSLEEELPGASLLAAFERTASQLESDPGRADFTALRTAVERERGSLDPAVVRSVEDARFSLLAGNPEQAIERLHQARATLGNDAQLLPLARVQGQLEEALERIEGRDVQATDRSLTEARNQLRELQTRAPLVPVRWNLRGAASAADAGAWDEAERQLADAARTLEEIREADGVPLAAEVDELETRARDFLRRMDAGQRPTPAQLRELAARTLDVRQAG